MNLRSGGNGNREEKKVRSLTWKIQKTKWICQIHSGRYCSLCVSLPLPHALNSTCTWLAVGSAMLRQLGAGLPQIFCEMCPPILGVHFPMQGFFFFPSVNTQKQPYMNSLFSAVALCNWRGRLLSDTSSSRSSVTHATLTLLFSS